MDENLYKTGVYKIINIVNNKVYIGSTADKLGFKHRWKCHLVALRANKHCNTYLQRAFNKYSEESFKFEILEICSKEDCIKLEQHYLDLFKSYEIDVGYNLCKTAGNTLGRKHSEETKIKIAKNRTYGEPANKNKSMTQEARNNMSHAQKNSLKNKQHLATLNKSKRKPVIGTNIDTGETIFLEHTKASTIFLSSGIVACCKGRWPHYKGYRWRYA